jgi:glycosyltransferase involved in cell wall biosynthesis
MTKSTLSIIIIAGNEEEMISDCLSSSLFADEIIVVLANSSDKTESIIKKDFSSVKIIKTTDEYNKNFSKWRNLGFKNASKDWLLYVDADERVSESLKQEILEIINLSSQENYFVIPRANFFLGNRVRHGNSYPDYVKRLFLKSEFKGYQGILHEEPIINLPFGYLKNDLLHYTHRQINTMLQKSLAWTEMEAQALYDNHHPPVFWWRLPRMMIWKFYQRYFKEKMILDGTVGLISSIFESFDTFIIYARLWELQHHDQKSRHL